MRHFLGFAVLAAIVSLPANAAYIDGSTGSVAGQLSIHTTTGDFTNDAFDTGWYNSTGDHDSGNKNYIQSNTAFACSDSGCAPANINDYFAFRLGNGIITGTVLSATLTVPNPVGGYNGPAGGLVSSLWDVTTNVNTLTADQGGLTAIFTDLGSGTLYGSQSVSLANDGGNVVYGLNAAGLAAIQSAAAVNGSSLFAIGGSLGGPVGSSAPEPSSVVLLGWGLVALAGIARRRVRR